MLGFFPFIAWVVVLIVHIESAKADLAEGTNGSLQIPEFVNSLLCTQLLYPTLHSLSLSPHILCIVFSDGTVVIYSSFSFVMPIFQYLPPGYYFGSEICCTLQIHASCTTRLLANNSHVRFTPTTDCVLSALAKVFLGSVLLVNVIAQEQRAEELLGAGGLVSAR